MKTLIQKLNSIENKLGLSDDAIIHKAMQEILEFTEAIQQDDKGEIIGEAHDAIANIISAHYRVSGSIVDHTPLSANITALQLTINAGKRNDNIQTYRKIYSRASISQETLSKSTISNIASILGLVKIHTNQSLELKQVLQTAIKKFEGRVDAYGGEVTISDYIADIPDFPKKGILFKDISPLLQNPRALQRTIHQLSNKVKDADVIVGLDARGFIFGVVVASYLGKPFVMVRKKGKLPGKTVEESYDLEYGSDTQAIQYNAIKRGQKVAIIDDLLATGGTAAAACKLVESLGGIVQGCHFVIELNDLKGRQNLKNTHTTTIINY